MLTENAPLIALEQVLLLHLNSFGLKILPSHVLTVSWYDSEHFLCVVMWVFVEDRIGVFIDMIWSKPSVFIKNENQ